MSEEYHEVGCRKCSRGGTWRIFTNGSGFFVAKHDCGHKVIIDTTSITEKPDVQALDARFFT